MLSEDISESWAKSWRNLLATEMYISTSFVPNEGDPLLDYIIRMCSQVYFESGAGPGEINLMLERELLKGSALTLSVARYTPILRMSVRHSVITSSVVWLWVTSSKVTGTSTLVAFHCEKSLVGML